MWNKPITRPSGVRSLDPLKKYYLIPEFRVGGSYELGGQELWEFGGRDGVTLESLGSGPLRTAYIAEGTPKYDEHGRIDNAIIINSYYSGDSTWMRYFWFSGQPGNQFALGPVVGPGELIDTNEFYLVFLDALGLWGASKPSDGLGLKFPQYSLYDVVQANYRLLRDHLNIGRIRLSAGVSNGGTQSYIWALLHPEFVDAIMVLGGLVSTLDDPVIRWTFELMSQAMKSDPVWRETNGDYYHLPKEEHPNRGMMFGWSIILRDAMNLDHRIEMGWEETQKEVFSWRGEGDMGVGLKEKARNYDVNDLLMRNRTQENFHLTPHLETIKAKTLIMHVEDDLWLRPKPALKAAELIPDARYYSFANKLGHYGLFQAPNIMREKVSEFFEYISL
jgi:homoserine acetyltransferase